MTVALQPIDVRLASSFGNEPEVEAHAVHFLKTLGYVVKSRKAGIPALDKNWPSKSKLAAAPGEPDLLVFAGGGNPSCVWENKGPLESVESALSDARFYVEGLHRNMPAKPNLPRLAAGFNGSDLRLAYLNHQMKWVQVRAAGDPVVDAFPRAEFMANGIAANGNLVAISGPASVADLRNALPALKTLYRSIPLLVGGTRPVDFTIALLTLRILVEMNADWGTWAEQPSLVPDAPTLDHAIAERFVTLTRRVLDSACLRSRYGDIFEFREGIKTQEEVAFSFADSLAAIEKGCDFYARMFYIIDELPPLAGADFDIFGEVYQAIGDKATKKRLGEFFTGRHIISAVVPVLFERSGCTTYTDHMRQRSVADIACGTGGFLTETLRYARRRFALDEAAARAYASSALYGYDLMHSSASRARVNMYFAGDGFSVIEGGVDSLASGPLKSMPRDGFHYILTNPPYGSSSKYQRLEEAFLRRALSLLRPGSGWGLVVLPVGVLENPRSSDTRRELIAKARVSDVILLPRHAFAPYTQQQTGIVIFERRLKALSGGDWASVVSDAAHEEISLFIVDNDGFANSDKRFETSRKLPTGEWIHDDLRSWVNLEGKTIPGRLFAALILQRDPGECENEFGDGLASKYGRVTLGELFEQSGGNTSANSRGVNLLPTAFLRSSHTPLAFSEFTRRCEALFEHSQGSDQPFRGSFADEIKAIMASPVDFLDDEAERKAIGAVFDFRKGNQGLTEAIIYRQHMPDGLPVYGGGAGAPIGRIAPSAKNKAGSPVAIHSGPCLIVSMDGSSGAVHVIESGQFACNHHACVLFPKPGHKPNLHYVAQQIEGALRAVASNQGSSATLTKPLLLSSEYSVASDSTQMAQVGDYRRRLARLRALFLDA